MYRFKCLYSIFTISILSRYFLDYIIEMVKSNISLKNETSDLILMTAAVNVRHQDIVYNA